MNYQYEKHFSLKEANEMLPGIRQLFKQVHALLGLKEEVETPPAQEEAEFSSQSTVIFPTLDYNQWSQEKRKEAAYRLLFALEQKGIVIQDVERGLIDFPTILNGREVFLCHELKDGPFVGYFHDLDKGFAGRRTL